MNKIEVEESDRHVVTLWLNNSRRLNALSTLMIGRLGEELERLSLDTTCRAVVLRGRGGVFSAGRDLSDIKALQSASSDEVEQMYRDQQRMNEAFYHFPHPIIAVVEKYALGLGTMVATWADIVLAERTALFGYPEVQHGMAPFSAIPTMLSSMSSKAMMDLLLTGRKIDATEAVRYGIATRAVPAEQLTTELEAILENIFRGSGEAISKSKQFVRQCETLNYLDALDISTDKGITGFNMPERHKGISAFLDKRNPTWP